MATYVDIKGKYPPIESDATLAEAMAKLPDSDFAQSLKDTYRRYGKLSEAQTYWAYKLAFPAIRRIQLFDDMEAFCSRAEQLVFDWEGVGSVRIRYGKVYCGQRYCGKLVGNTFEAAENCPQAIIDRLTTFSLAPMHFLQSEGRATGRCCVCGLTLTNPESIELGIGPICRSKW